MKNLLISTTLSMCLTLVVVAAELSPSSLTGKWIFTHMNMDGGGDISINIPMEFLGDGTVVNSDAHGEKKSTASYRIENDTILYEDQRGMQKWRVESFGDDSLQLDHAGAKMFFKRL